MDIRFKNSNRLLSHVHYPLLLQSGWYLRNVTEQKQTMALDPNASTEMSSSGVPFSSIDNIETSESGDGEDFSHKNKRTWTLFSPKKRLRYDYRYLSSSHLKNSSESNTDPSISYMLDDVFLHMLTFFVSKSGVVDGQSMRSIMCVNKKWHELSSSKVLWSAAAGIHSLPDTYLSTNYRPTRPSFRIREVIPNSPGLSSPVSSTLVGFANLGKQVCGSDGTWFQTRERATGRLFFLHIPPDSNKTCEMLQEISRAHQIAGDEFLEDHAAETARSESRLPRGIGIVDGRLLRWYNTGGQILKNWIAKKQSQATVHVSPPISYKERTLECFGPSRNLNRRHVRVDQWAHLVDWIIEVVDVFDLHDSVVYKAMTYFDQFTSSSKKLPSRKYQLVAGACLFIASKCEDCLISESNLAVCADNTFGGGHVVAAEEVVLRTLDWKLSYPGIYDFVKGYILSMDLANDCRTAWMIRYISDLALQSSYLKFRPSMIAACVVSMALHCLESDDIWPAPLKKASGYLWGELECCMLELSANIDHVRSTMPDLKMISRRYRQVERDRVSLVHIPRVTSFLALGRNIHTFM